MSAEIESWGDFLISGIKKSTTAFSNRITHFQVRIDKGSKVGAPKRWTKDEVLHMLNKGYKFVTITASGDKWSEGAEVHSYEENGEIYLRTDRNRTKADNLDNLPEF